MGGRGDKLEDGGFTEYKYTSERSVDGIKVVKLANYQKRSMKPPLFSNIS